MKTKRILIVDDKETMWFLLSEVLRPLGQEIETAESGEKALQKLAEKSFDLVIIDCLICTTNDLDLLQSIKKIYPSLPVLVMNTNGCEGELLEKGALACIRRPLNTAQLKMISHLILSDTLSPAPLH
jgi:DNA-binding NtrC family response regulator